jgi:hypothetical protein
LVVDGFVSVERSPAHFNNRLRSPHRALCASDPAFVAGSERYEEFFHRKSLVPECNSMQPAELLAFGAS